jgi:CheY-like chemotaxis protein
MSRSQADVLVVEDDLTLRTTLPLILRVVGYKVRSASDGADALAEIANRVPDILISDLHMPGMSGFDLLRIVHAQYPAIRTIAMSSEFLDNGLIPSEIEAEAFHPKASGVPALLRMVGAMLPMAA